MKLFRSRILLLMLIFGAAIVLITGFLLYRDIRDSLTLIHPAATALLEDWRGGFLSESALSGERGIGYWDVADPLPERIEAAVLITEDRRFYEHPGIDARAVARALWHNVTSPGRQGASTIAMQVARMQRSLSADAPIPRTYWQKLCESVVALELIRRFGHQAVLRQYLALVPQGNRIHGVAYAARRYFRKPLNDLSWAEAALLAALPKAPGRMNLFQPEGQRRAVQRAGSIMALLRDSGMLGEPEYQAATRQLARMTTPDRELRPNHSVHAILRIENLLRERGAHRYNAPVRTTLDLDIQQKACELARMTMERHRSAGAGNVAVMAVETATGKVVAYIGSDEYANPQHAGAINYARVRRSSGSTLKPFIYALGLEQRLFTPASLLSDMPIVVPLPFGHYQIGNYDGKNFGTLLYRNALANSRNVPAVHVLARVGVENAYELFRQLGLADPRGTAREYGVGMAIGTLYVTLEDLVAAYGVLANDGRPFRLHWFEAEFGNELMQPERAAQVLDRNVARQISLFLSDPLARLPTFPRMGALEYPFPVAVKTGTSQGFRDAWAVAYSARYIVGAWIGHPENSRMRQVSGAAAAELVKRLMLDLHPQERRGVGVQPFAPPEGYERVTICASTGKAADERCPETVAEYFAPGTQPTAASLSAYGSIGLQTGLQAFPPEAAPPPVSAQSFAFMQSPFSFQALLNAAISIREPTEGTVFVLDPDTPRGAQTVPLQAVVFPRVAKIVWYVDGEPLGAAAYPYTLRWPLEPGEHVIQAGFPNADIQSEAVAITVY